MAAGWLITAVSLHATPTNTAWYVDAATGSDSNDCLSAATACLTVGEAVARASDDDVIEIAAGVYEENLEINRALQLVGTGKDETFLDGGDAGRVISAASNDVTLNGLTIRHGRVSNLDGGGIYNLGTLVLQGVRVTENTAVNGGGGGIYNSGTLLLYGSEVSDNSSDGVGGGVYNWYGSTISGNSSQISGNSGHQGGGLYNLGTIIMLQTTISENSATGYSGGGLINFSGNITLENVTISGNNTVANGGGISNQMGSIVLTNATISGNTAEQYGGLSNESAPAQVSLFNSTVAYNTATGSGTPIGGIGNLGLIQFSNTIVADNNGRNCQVSGGWTSNGNNLSTDNHCAFNGPGDLPNTPADLAPLAYYNEFPTAVHGLRRGSAAIDAGTSTYCPPQDQRGVNRPVDGDGDGTAVCDIGAFEVISQLSVDDVSVLEGDSGTTTAVFTVSLFPPADQDVDVEYSTDDGSAQGGSDYTWQTGTLTFAAGETEQTISVDVIGDVDDEPDETFFVHLSSTPLADLIDAEGVGAIVDDDGLPSLTVADASVKEGDSGTAVAAFTVTLSPAATANVTVDVATSDGTALAGSDYTAVSQTLTFTPGQTTHQVAVNVIGDTVDEGNSEKFSLNLTNAAGANLTDGTALGTIRDDDTARVGVQPGPAVYEGDSGSKTAVFIVTLSHTTAFTVTVAYETTSGSGSSAATPGVDYEPASGTLTFAPGETSHTIPITIYGDTDEEPDEQFDLFLSSADPVPIYANVSTATILNDEGVFWLYLPVMSKP